MNLRKSLILLMCSLSLTCFSCGSDDLFEDDIIIINNDSILSNDGNSQNNDSTNVDSTKTNTNNTNPSIHRDDNSYNIDSLFIDTTSVVSITGFSKYMGQSSQGSVQGAAAFGDYLFQFQDHNEAVYVYNLVSKSLIKKVELVPNNNNHCNQVSFSNIFYSNEDKFPLIYVSGGRIANYNQIQVYRIIGDDENIDIRKIQDIILPPKNTTNYCYWTCSILDNDNQFFYAYASNASTRLIKFKIPDYHDKEVNLKNEDILDFIPVEHIAHQQGGIIKNGIFYMIYGVPGWGDQVWLRLFNLLTRKEIVRYNLTEKKIKGEPESIFFYKNELYIITNNAGIYKIHFTKD